MKNNIIASRAALSGIAAALLCGTVFGSAMAAGAAPNVPDLMSNNMGFSGNGGVFLPVPGEKFEPIGNDPKHPYCGNRILPQCGNVVLPRISDTTNPILQPWAAKQMADINAETLKGKQVFNPMSRCWPGGVPGMMTFTAEPAYFLQTPKEVTIAYARGPNIRHVYMGVPHSKTVPQTWYGESVGHYDGEEFVIDTIGVTTKANIDSYGTPHSDKLHTVEHYKIVPKADLTGNAGGIPSINGPALQGIVDIEDPGAFTTPWKGLRTFNMQHQPISESENICAENNDANYFNEDEVPVPQTKRADF